VTYDIPAIKFNFPIETVVKVRKSDLDAFADTVVNILQNYRYWIKKVEKVNISYVKVFTWDNVAAAEAKLYKTLIHSAGR
jgi:glycosyltransferase involved in cell wall biosynthesis